jgi:hypothetical protein
LTENNKTETPKRLPVDDLLTQVRLERMAHIANWGEQAHESYKGESDRRKYERLAQHYKAIWDAQNAADAIGWDVVLLEEVYEALSEIDPEKRKYELIQVAAVALAEIESIDARAGILTNAEAVGDVE